MSDDGIFRPDGGQLEPDDQRLAALEQRIAALEGRGGIATPAPWSWKNPLANKMAQGALTSTKSSVIQIHTSPTGDFTTTNTTDYQTVASASLKIPVGRVALYLWANFGAKHSAGTATFDAVLAVGDASTTYILQQIPGIALRTANDVVPVGLSISVDVAASLPALIRGNCTIGLLVFNRTTGTLTVLDDAQVHGFVTGRSSLS